MSLINQNKYNMKKLLRLFPLLLLCACVLTACGGDDDGDGDSISNPAENEYVINGHKFIDLGLPSGFVSGPIVMWGLLLRKTVAIIMHGERRNRSRMVIIHGRNISSMEIMEYRNTILLMPR